MEIKDALKLPSGMYSGTHDGNRGAMLFREEGHGFSLWVPGNRDCYEVSDYDEDGNLVEIRIFR